MNPVITRKICLLGDFGVGKTSLVQRFVNQVFQEKYITTVGVRVDTRSVVLASGSQVKMAIWDIAGRDSLTATIRNYLRGSGGIMLVADGTRHDTASSLHTLLAEVQETLGPVPRVALLNKSDLRDQWKVDPMQLQNSLGPVECFETSALTGERVEAAFLQLATLMAEGGR